MNVAKVKRAISKEAPMLLTLAGISGFVSATILAIKATPAANKALERKEVLPWWDEIDGYEKKIEQLKVVFPIYAPAIGMMLLSMAFVLGSQHISYKRYAAVSSLYMASQRYLSNLQERVIEEVGEKKFDRIRNEAIAPREDPPENLVITAGENVLIYDVYSDRYFRQPSVEHIRSVINDINEQLFTEMFVPINDFYFEVGLKPVGSGDDIGWAIEQGSVGIRLGSALTPDKRPCVTIDFDVVPRHIYDRLGDK